MPSNDDEDGPAAARRWLYEPNVTENPRFRDCVQARLRAAPRTQCSGNWNLVVAERLDRLTTTTFPELEIPPDPLEITEKYLFAPRYLVIIPHNPLPSPRRRAVSGATRPQAE